MAKCGPKKLWHWAHHGRRHCDPWWENETDWHRDWKSHFPEECREVVHFDLVTGEKHVADVKTKRGMVIEFQHSAMSAEELNSREQFYKHMIWIVDASAFKKDFEVMDPPLPHPKSKLLDEVVFHSQVPETFFKRADIAREPTSLHELHRAETIQSQILDDYRGHHFYKWKRARDIWLEASMPVFLDFGDEKLFRLMRYNPQSQRCVQIIPKLALLEKNGAYINVSPCEA